MALLKAANYSPDVADYMSSTSKLCYNVIPQGDGYGPHQDYVAYTKALPSNCRGSFYALKSDGSVVTFAATDTKLFVLNNTTFEWVDASKSGGSYSQIDKTAQWQFAQTGNFVFATQANAKLQVYNLSTGGTFTDALGNPPQAAYITVMGPFLMLSGLLSQPFRIQWSGLNDYNSATSWTVGTGFSDFQDFPDGGIVRGIAGGTQTGTIFQDQMLRSLAYVSGSALVFQIDKISEGFGLYAPYTLVKVAGYVFFYAGQGFHKIASGGAPAPIGRERVDRTFLKNLDISNLQLFMGVADPRSTRIYWSYKSKAGIANNYDKLLIYDYLLDQWSLVNMTGHYLMGVSQAGATLESLDAIAPTPLQITGAANNGSGAIRLTLPALNNAQFQLNLVHQNLIAVYNVGGTTEANGVWSYTIVDSTHIDLVGSTFTHTYTSGGQIGGSLDAMTLSFDEYATAVQPQLAQFNTDAKLGFFTGQNLEATIQTGEQGGDGTALSVQGFKPITDAAAVYGAYTSRMTQRDVPVTSPENKMSIRTGRVNRQKESWYIRFQVRIPAGTPWTFFAGVEPDAGAGGAT